jgi:hypothetical protein
MGVDKYILWKWFNFHWILFLSERCKMKLYGASTLKDIFQITTKVNESYNNLVSRTWIPHLAVLYSTITNKSSVIHFM